MKMQYVYNWRNVLGLNIKQWGMLHPTGVVQTQLAVRAVLEAAF